MIKLKYLLDESRAMTPMKHSEWYPAHTRDALEWTLTHNYVPIYSGPNINRPFPQGCVMDESIPGLGPNGNITQKYLDDNYSIEVALAGFNKNDVEVEFVVNLLTVRTKQFNKSDDKNEDGEIIHKGISQRQFARSFTIADDVKVNGAELKDGLLTIACERILPDHKKKRLIDIK